MRRLFTLLIVTAGLPALSGCALSIHPLHSKDTVQNGGELRGDWIVPQKGKNAKNLTEVYEFDWGGRADYSYDVTYIKTSKGEKIDVAFWEAHLVKLGDAYYLDAQPRDFELVESPSQQLYVMDSDGEKVKRISFSKGRYATPVWSPRGDLIAFTKISGGRFYIGVMRPDGSSERLLTDGYLVEAPTWAPNGRVLIYFKQVPGDANGRGGSVKLYSIDLTGYNEREVITPLDGSDPAWSPLIP